VAAARDVGEPIEATSVKRFEALPVIDLPFRVDLISQTPAPDGSSDVWHRYSISQGTNTITGLRPGTRSDVAFQLEEMVARLNERRMGKKAR
jgi:hypothetical protein